MERAVCYQIESRCVSGARERRISRSFKDNALALGSAHMRDFRLHFAGSSLRVSF